MKSVVFTLFLALDLASYCKGYCQTRYMDGTYIESKNVCACMDFSKPKFSKPLEVPKKRKAEFDEPHVYDGKDEMHYPAPENY